MYISSGLVFSAHDKNHAQPITVCRNVLREGTFGVNILFYNEFIPQQQKAAADRIMFGKFKDIHCASGFF